MKTQHLRKDKTCLNCGHEVPERFCTHCGQENVETKESFSHLVSHFFQDITHYDSKFLLTNKYLFTRPGKLTADYIEGRRLTYVNPIRLYVFTSFVFFLLMSSFKYDAINVNGNPKDAQKAFDTVLTALNRSEAAYRDSLSRATNFRDSVRFQREIVDANIGKMAVTSDQKIDSDEKYDSLVNTLPPEYRPNWIEKKTMLRMASMQKKYGNDVGDVYEESMKHNYPKLMFLLLPFFALVMKWFFRRKDMVFVDHAIFSIHFHTFIFMAGIVGMLIDKYLDWWWIYNCLLVIVFIYFVAATMRTYRYSFISSLVRSLLALTVYITGSLFVFIFFVLITFAFI